VICTTDQNIDEKDYNDTGGNESKAHSIPKSQLHNNS